MSFPKKTNNDAPTLIRGHRPRIGITTRLEVETDRFYLSRNYSEAVEAAGGVPVHISLIPRREYISAIMDGLDGMLLPGSDSDVDPLRYGAEPHARLGSVVTIKDETDLLVLEEIDNRGMPLFAICFGMQVLNVFRGGTLIQDIESQVPRAIKHEQGVPRDRPSHNIKLAKSGLLSSLVKGERVVVNSHHHQAIDKVGSNLVATAWTSDKLIEAIEDPRPETFVLGVQWHPELGWMQDLLSQALFDRFIAAARDYLGRRQNAALDGSNGFVKRKQPRNQLALRKATRKERT
ncbi:MAG: gamma-glutamyl-gamma-aminobutyrate hydrolase family protein [Acidobacteriota bacterium]|nr:gamma-glutamyl-gamma-aminobutyrate hydrolase family protein [Acidobacteriota bacterium]